ncbi:2-amino-4-hydroxy-6-hydroxymethyldihydropteridine diphosphokinase [Marivirga arenosa]|uniref:2-amino-4-hydroxy-6-hydroxymethyldihydropteridine pyrophosphokinase n=1 Tax=Marivirga arenosa TaxID=3059076 RepID=A0AA51N6R5_9BACT|nr:2-amino-4-hydroxy-6-hydroxymethyldihydropteridine diphosphokinase [Marivirga sp. ABR2-2]WMN07113.1 2-amino-4-hydroxy-6-hydroxymethyldihydropteridine diphosphokinase [Marivirga sp. ABR2-2]
MEGIYLLLGSNLGDRAKILMDAIELLRKNNIKVIQQSSVYETAAWGKTDQQSFLNQVVLVESDKQPKQLLDLLLRIELDLGRVRKEKWGERLIDIDILYYNSEVVKEDDLIIPHPGIPDRKFTLIPLAELSPDGIHPVLKMTQSELLSNCDDDLDVSPFKD